MIGAYPWGEKADPNLANYSETQINATNAVGCFPKGSKSLWCRRDEWQCVGMDAECLTRRKPYTKDLKAWAAREYLAASD